MDSNYEAAAEVRDGLYKIAGDVKDLVDAVLAQKKGPRANEGHGETSATGRS